MKLNFIKTLLLTLILVSPLSMAATTTSSSSIWDAFLSWIDSLSSTTTTSSDDTSDDSSSSDSTDDVATDDSDDTSSDDDTASATDSCGDEDTDIETIVCASEAFLDTLSTTEYDAVIYDWDDSDARTVWSNLPTGGVARNGLAFEDLSDESLTAVLALADAVLSDDGYEDFAGVRAADDYLGELSNSDGYSSGLYYVAFFGEPSTSGEWMLQIGGHHLAYNITFLSGTGYPAPNFIGIEPKASFEYDSVTYAPLVEEGEAMVAMFDALNSTELASAYLDGESFSDVLIGPDNGSGELPTDDYPTGEDREGVLVSTLTDEQQALVTAAIKQWVADFADDISADLIDEYTTDNAYTDTYIAWGGDEDEGVDVETEGTYMRIDGPRVWIEVACQAAVVLSNVTHYHTIYRDKTYDYGNSL